MLKPPVVPGTVPCAAGACMQMPACFSCLAMVDSRIVLCDAYLIMYFSTVCALRTQTAMQTKLVAVAKQGLLHAAAHWHCRDVN
jgi:hypothetical protein